MSSGCAAMKRQVVQDIEQFLFREARLLDEFRFGEWLDLLTDDIRYWMPSMGRRYRTASKAIAILNRDSYDEREFTNESELAIMDESKDSLTRRVTRLDTGMAWAEDPPSRTCHIISNIIVQDADSAPEMRVSSSFILYRSRGEQEEDFFVGSRDDLLRPVEGGWKIAYRKILLPQNVLSSKNASIFF